MVLKFDLSCEGGEQRLVEITKKQYDFFIDKEEDFIRDREMDLLIVVENFKK